MSSREAWILNLIQSVGERMMASVLDDWAAMFGLSATSTAATAEDPMFGCTVEEFLEGAAGLIRSRIEIDHMHSGPIVMLFSGQTVMQYVGELTMLPESARAERAENGLHEEDLEAFRELGNLACGACNNVTRKLQGVMHVSQSVDDLDVDYFTAGAEIDLEEQVPEAPHVIARLTLSLPDGSREPALLLFSREVAGHIDAGLRQVLRRGA